MTTESLLATIAGQLFVIVLFLGAILGRMR
jgi:hypothetical protein